MSLKINFVAILLLFSVFSNAQTNVSGTISSNTTWNLANSPYTVTGNITVNSATTLIIEAGVLVKVNAGLKITVNGEIIAIGNQTSPIIFTSNLSSPSAGDWVGIIMENGSVDASFNTAGNYVSGSVFEFVNMDFGGGASGTSGTKPLLQIFDCYPYLKNLRISNSQSIGIRFYSYPISPSSPTIKLINSDVYNNSNDGLEVDGMSVFIDNCNIHDNSGTAIRERTPSLTKFILSNSILKNNLQGGVGGSSPETKITKNIFYNNKTGLAGGQPVTGNSSFIFKHNIVVGNTYFGLHFRGQVYLQDSTILSFNHVYKVDSNIFVDNGGSILIHGHDTSKFSIKNNHFYQSFGLGFPSWLVQGSVIDLSPDGFTSKFNFGIQHNLFNENSTNTASGASGSTVSTTPFGNISLSLNNIFNNTDPYFLTVPSSSGGSSNRTINLNNNFWNETTISNINLGIYDGLDNSSRTTSNLSNYLVNMDTTAPISPPTLVSKSLSSSGNVKLQWNANAEGDLAGYKIYWQNPSGYSFDTMVDVGNVLSYTLNGVTDLSSEYSLVAYDNSANGNEMDVFEGHQSWFSSSQKFSPSIVVSDFNGSAISCHGDSNGHISLNITDGVGPYTFSWEHDPTLTTNQASNLFAGNYAFSITDQNGLTFSDSLIISEPDSLQVSVSKTDVFCAGTNNGTISFSTIGGKAPFQYSIDNGSSYSNSPTFGSLAPGFYSLRILDTNNCAFDDTITIHQLGFLNLSLDSSRNLNCFGDTNGSISTTASGGVLPYSYLWNNGDTIADISNLAANSYSLTVTDATGCSRSLIHNITEPPALVVGSLVSNFNGNEISCFGADDGSITLNVSGGASPFTFSWTHDSTIISGTITNLNPGIYVYTVTDNNLCSISDSIVISQPDSLQIQAIRVNNSNCSNDSDGSIAIDLIGGTLPYSFSIYDSIGNIVSVSDSVGNLWHGNFSFSAIDANSCSVSSQNISIGYNHTPIKPIFMVSDSVVCHDSTALVSLNPGIQSVVWNDGHSGLSRNLPSGTYWLSSVDTNGCLSQSDTITINPLYAQDSSAQICLVTFDPFLGKNKIIFSKPTNEFGISTYNIYKDVFGTWQIIGSVNNGDSSQFVDNTSQPGSKVARYYLETEDQCGVTYSTLNSPIHKTILLQSSIGSNNEVNLSWNQYEGTPIWYYRILRSSNGGAYVAIDSVGSSFNTFIDYNPSLGSTSYFIEAVLYTGCSIKAKSKTYNSLTTNSVLENTIGLNEYSTVEFNIYPNPSDGLLNIEFLAENGTFELQLLDNKGKLIKSISTNDRNYQFNLSQFPKGLYHLKIITNKGVISKSITKY